MAAPSLQKLSISDLRSALKALVVTACADAGFATKAYARNLLALDEGADVAAYRDDGIPEPEEESDPEARPPMVNAVCFWGDSLLPPPTAFSPLTGRNIAPFDPRKEGTLKVLTQDVVTFRFRFYYAFRDGDESSNSTLEFEHIAETIKFYVDSRPKLGLNSYRIDRHSRLAWAELKTIPSGVEDPGTVHVGNGFLSVLIHAPGAAFEPTP